MDFSKALILVKEGYRISRQGWNGTALGKRLYVVYQKGYPDGIPINSNTSQATGLPVGMVCRFLPYLMMCTAQGDFVPWLASQSDILAEDWEAEAIVGSL